MTRSMRYYVLGFAVTFSCSMLNGAVQAFRALFFREVRAGKMADIPCSAALSWDAPARGDWLDLKVLSVVQ